MALKVLYPILCGMTFVVAVIAQTNDEVCRQLSNFTHSLKEPAQWLEYYPCFNVCMESTGKYWIPVYNVLGTSCTIYLSRSSQMC